jgi:ATP-binding cassette, subfamily B, bacterial HlyB/CyaB
MIKTQNIQEFLSFIDPFSQLDTSALAEVAGKLNPLRYRMGQVIMVREKMPPYISIVCEGEVRLLGYDPRTQMPASLKLVEAGAVLGAVDLLRGIPCETAIASTETICLTLSNKDFSDLLVKYPQLRSTFQERSSVVEVFDLLGALQQRSVQTEGNLKELATSVVDRARVYYLPSGTQDLRANHSTLIDPDWVWLVSGGGEIANFPVGSSLTGQETLEVKGSTSARLVGIPRSYIAFEQNDTVTMTDSESITKLDWEGMDIADAPELEIAEADEREGKVEVVEKSQRKYPFFGGKTTLDAAVACFQMLSKYFGMPFRRDVIGRVIAEQIDRTGGISLPACGAIAELLGLTGQLVGVPSKFFTRLTVPVVIRWQDGLAVVYEISDREIIFAVPEIGILRRKPEDFFSIWGEEGQVLILRKNKETPQERFGLSWFLPYLVKYRRVLIEVLIASFFVQLFALANPLMIQTILDKAIGQNATETLVYLIIFLVGVSFFEALLTALRTYLFVDTTNRIDMTLGSQIIDHLLRLPLRYFEKRPVGEISTRINELENIRQFMTGTALTVVLDAVFSVIYIVVMLFYSWVMTAISLGFIPLFIALTLFFSPTIRRQLREKAERNSQTQSYLVEVMSGIQTVKAQNIELRSRWQWQEKYARYISAGFKNVVTSTIAASASTFLNKLSAVLVIGVGAYLVINKELTVGQLIAFRILSGYVTSPILRLAQLWQNFQETALSLERLADIVDTPQEAEQDRDNITMPVIVGRVRYDNVSFRFKSSGPMQLSNVNLEFAPGQFVAVVGESGAGKSTLTKLVSRLYEPESGRILIDGYDINKVELYSLRRQVGVVPQDPLLFDGSIQENIALTNPEASSEEIIHAAQVAAAHEFIMNLPNGYNTRVGERGSALSGGQRQRIAIARSVLQNPRILVLDEATSALDYATEQEVCINLAEAFRDRTVFFITHRLGTIQNADVIVMMDSGSVVEEGTHEELMALKGRYYYLYQQQQKE